MNEDLIEKISLFIERQCPRKMFPGMKCSEHNCTMHWLAAQVRSRKFEGLEANVVSSISTPTGSENWIKRAHDAQKVAQDAEDAKELFKAQEEFLRRHL